MFYLRTPDIIVVLGQYQVTQNSNHCNGLLTIVTQERNNLLKIGYNTFLVLQNINTETGELFVQRESEINLDAVIFSLLKIKEHI